MTRGRQGQLAGLACVLALCAQTAAAGIIESGRLPDGSYECTMASGSMVMLMGDMRIKGMSYQGPAFDGKYAGAYPYVLSSKVILWKGPLGGLSTGGNSVVSTVIDNNDPRQAVFHMVVQSSPGNYHDVSCSLMH